jgi:transposase
VVEAWEEAMYRKLPTISESAEELRQVMRKERNAKKRERLQMLYLLVTKQASSRKAVAAQLGVYRETVGHWLNAYEQGGLDKLLDLYVPAGRAASVSGDALLALEQALHDPKGFGSYDEIRVWLFEQHAISMSTDAVGQLVRHKFGGKPKVPRPQAKKKSPASTQSPRSRSRSPSD